MAIFASVVFATLLPIVCKVTVFFSHNQISTYFLQKKIVFASSLLPSFEFGYSCSVLAATVPRALGHLEYLERLLFSVLSSPPFHSFPPVAPVHPEHPVFTLLLRVQKGLLRRDTEPIPKPPLPIAYCPLPISTLN